MLQNRPGIPPCALPEGFRTHFPSMFWCVADARAFGL
jgi:hypothetical protein